MDTAQIRWVGKCQCGAKVSADMTRDTASLASYQVRDSAGHWVIVREVIVDAGQRRCGAYCEDATTSSCKCSCGGAQHGITWKIR